MDNKKFSGNRLMNPVMSTWPSIYSTLSDGQGGEVIVREVGKGTYALNAQPPVLARVNRNKAKCKQQRCARKGKKK